MSRYNENPGQVALLLAGVTLASLLLIVLFTADTKGRRPNRDLAFEGISSLRQPGYVHLASVGVGEEERRGAGGPSGRRVKRGLGNGGSGGGRGGLQVSRDDQEDEEGEEEEDLATPSTTTPTTTTTSTPRPHHALRHRHRQHSRHRPPTTPRTQHGAEEEGPPPRRPGGGWVPPPPPPPDAGPAPGLPRVTTFASGGEEEGEDGRGVTASSSSPRDGHAACYGPDQVVLIIALTCALNFACIFLVMALVHVCNRNRKCSSSGCDSPLLLVDSDFEAKACLAAAASTSGDEEDADEDEEDDWDEVDALLLSSSSSKRPFLEPPRAYRLAPFAPSLGPPPWRPTPLPPLHPFYPPLERRRPLPSSASSTAVASSRPLLPPAAFSMEDLHILE
ncbi:wiskott-Aldrich syndrome protein homolog [Ischnura elegans]|uniref:wiskott-Aldrich syndrome protein homolog n=1 Tax=Ischnura elegans TaxID=197161 RepID=UPI001ED8BC06|nr:wiskott-Aldrich syndrome protein homolog [Ischnura elegans]